MDFLASAMMYAEMQHLVNMAGRSGMIDGDKAIPPNVARAESATMAELAPHLPRIVDIKGHKDVQMMLRTSSSLGTAARDALYGLWERNIKHLTDGTEMEMDEEDKRAEMFHSKARFLILLKRAPPTPPPTSGPLNGVDANAQAEGTGDGNGEVAKPKKKKKKKAEKLDFGTHELVGYCSFRFDTEETMEDDVVAQVIYCYELQLASPARGKGLGKMLMRELEQIGRARGMEKAFLTCLTSNKAATKFYTMIGYTPDEIDPTEMYGSEIASDEELDYILMSKSLRIEEIDEVATIEEIDDE